MLDYVDHNRESLKRRYPGFDGYKDKFQITDDMIETIVAQGEKEKIERDEESLRFTLDAMKRELKALIARDLYTPYEFYKIFYQDDEAILKALAVIRNQGQYNQMLVQAEQR